MSNTAAEQGTQSAGTQPEANGTQAERTFTQEKVNKIVSERLARERAKETTDPHTEELNKRENALLCKEFMIEKRLPEGVLEVFDTSNAETFKKQVNKLVEVFPQIIPGVPGGGCNPGNTSNFDPIAKAFNLKR